MKKIIALILSALLVLTAFYGCSNSNKDIYIGEGKMTVIRSLVSTNGFLANDVFGANHLPVDVSQTVTHNSRTFAPVVSDKFSSYSQLEALVNSTYTEETAKKLLNEPQKYIDIDGKLYFDLHYAVTENAEYDWSDFNIEFQKINDDGSYLFKVKLKKTNGFNSTVKINVSDTDGVIRLCEFYS